jgi:APA family basic amino acid/polyamine antiporter
MGRWELTAVAINGIVGAGIFGLPSKVYALAGDYSLVAYAVCAVFTGLIVLCFAEVGSRFSETGGPYLYAGAAFGPLAGFQAGWLLWLVRVTAFAANSNLLLEYAGNFWPAAAHGVTRVVLLSAIVAILLVINCVGIRTAAATSNVFTIAKLLGLGLFVMVGLAFVDWNRFGAAPVPESGSVSLAVLLLVYAFTGFEMASVPAAEANDPRRHLPVAILVAVAVTATLYFLIQLVAIGTLPELAASQKPLADAASRSLGTAGSAALTVAAIIAIAGNLNITLLAGSRLPFAMAERKELPSLLARVHPRFHTPHWALIVTGGLMLLLAVSGTFAYALTISAVSRVAVYLLTCMSLPALRRSQPGGARFRIPWGVAVAVAATVVGVWLLAHTSWREGRDSLLACAAGFAVYGIGRARGASKRHERAAD